MIRFAAGTILLFALALTAVMSSQRGAVRSEIPFLPDEYLPGHILPVSSTCDWMATAYYNAYCEGQPDHRISFAYDLHTYRILQTNMFIYYEHISIGDLINKLGTPDSLRGTGTARHVCWKLFCAYVNTMVFQPAAQVGYFEYVLTPNPDAVAWRGFQQ